MQLVILPIADALLAIRVGIGSPTIGLVIDPVPLVHIAISMDQSAFITLFAIFPVTHVYGAICLDLNTASLPDLSADFPLADVAGSAI